jgi:hypothetical protein
MPDSHGFPKGVGKVSSRPSSYPPIKLFWWALSGLEGQSKKMANGLHCEGAVVASRLIRRRER